MSQSGSSTEHLKAFRSRLDLLGIDRLVLAIHDVSFPGGADDVGRGTPQSEAGKDFIAFVRALGFDGLQLGPQGAVTRVNPSPYDGTWMSRNPLSLALGPLIADGLIPARVVQKWGAPAGTDADHVRAYDAIEDAMAAAAERFFQGAGPGPQLAERYQAFVAGEAAWLGPDAAFEALAAAHGHDDWQRWTGAREPDLAAADRWRLTQFLAHEQHAKFHAHATALGLRLYGDLQVGPSHRDAWARRQLFLAGYLMGAPPSRTNPEGQPWGYPLLDPEQVEPPGAAKAFFAARMDKMLGEYDGVRIDHPHGIVCPWVYRADDPVPLSAVQAGARLHEAPDLPDHPALARFARVRADQLDRTRPRHHDLWVRELSPEQIARYSVLIDVVLERARAHGRPSTDVLAEVLSTCPTPLGAVLARHRLGRFRVTQKANLDDPSDVYRSENAAPEDWIMVGNHDTRPLWGLARDWSSSDEGARRAAYLAERLEPRAAARPAFAQRIARDPSALAHALVADLLASPARHVSIFFADVFGLDQIYNRPGVVDSANWRLRVPPDYRTSYPRRAARGEALDLGRAIDLALHARGLSRGESSPG